MKVVFSQFHTKMLTSANSIVDFQTVLSARLFWVYLAASYQAQWQLKDLRRWNWGWQNLPPPPLPLPSPTCKKSWKALLCLIVLTLWIPGLRTTPKDFSSINLFRNLKMGLKLQFSQLFCQLCCECKEGALMFHSDKDYTSLILSWVINWQNLTSIYVTIGWVGVKSI